MLSPISSNTPGSKLGDVVHIGNKGSSPIPSIDPEIIFAANPAFDDTDSMLHEISVRSASIASSPSSMTLVEDDMNKPRACRDLRTLMTKDERGRNFVKLPTSRSIPRNRLESLVDIEHEDKDEDHPNGAFDKENRAVNADANTSKKRFRSMLFQKAQSIKKAKHADHSPVVWVIEPSLNEDGTLRFKFTTDAGACLILREDEALESIEIMKASSRTNAYFQVYCIEGKESRVIKPERISKAIEEIIAEMKPKLIEEDVLTAEASAKTKHWIGHRFYRFLLRRRWKKLVRRQIRIATGESRKGRRFVSMLFPYALVWKRLDRHNRTAV